MMRASSVICVLLAGCVGQPTQVKAEVAPDMRGTLVEYATASCLAYQSNAYLKDQGERWAGAIVQNARGSIEKWTPVADAVKSELARFGVAQGQGEGPQAPTVPLPVITCGRIATTPAVSRSIDTAAKSLREDY